LLLRAALRVAKLAAANRAAPAAAPAAKRAAERDARGVEEDDSELIERRGIEEEKKCFCSPSLSKKKKKRTIPCSPNH
jgi:hypothetical protein